MHKKFSILIGAVAVFLLLENAPAIAQTAKATIPSDANVSSATSAPPAKDEDYLQANYANLSKSYWTLAMFDLSDNDAIDGYLQINQCELYKKYFKSDFELEGLREATRESIQKNMAGFPLKYEVIIPMGLGRYNTGTEKFAVEPKYQYLGSKRLEIADNNSFGDDICFQGQKQVAKYPINFVLSLNRPFTLTEVPVAPEVAQVYMEQSEQALARMPQNAQVSSLGRIAFLRLKISLTQFRGYTYPLAGVSTQYADVFGTIDSFEVYADRAKTLLLFNGSNVSQPRQTKGNRTEPVVPTGSGPLIEAAPDAGPQANPVNPGGTGADASGDTGIADHHFDLPPMNAPAKPAFSSESSMPVAPAQPNATPTSAAQPTKK